MNAPQVPTPLTELHHPLFDQYQVKVWIKRDDLNHPAIQGNKWHKLKLNIQAAQQQHKSTLLSFGGAYSNHIAATAAAAKAHGLHSIGFIRGEELENRPDKWSHTLQTAVQNGMQLQFLSRQSYKLKNTPEFLAALKEQYPDAYILPEGGSNSLAVQGFATLMQELEQQLPDWTQLYTAVGTGGTLAGLIKYAKLKPQRCIYGVATLKQADYLLPQISDWIGAGAHNKWQLLTKYHDGGYAKLSPQLQAFKQEFEQQFHIPLDPVYSVKMVNACFQQLQQGLIPPGSHIVLLHTGGLQGNAHTQTNP